MLLIRCKSLYTNKGRLVLLSGSKPINQSERDLTDTVKHVAKRIVLKVG